MSTNYYHRTNICDHCKRWDEKHIGLLACGWQFSFRAYDGLRSWQEWKTVIESGGEVRDEYGKPLSPKEFVALVEQTKGKQDHIQYCQQGTFSERIHIKDALADGTEFHDSEGWSFSESDFS